ncbi:hypothetical protein HBH56_111680 [Parastagonospora nodorum]|nr:hypothetical protein HBH56_111680 [Parastagonospora nodorum]KAH3925536.1 hypothetical protein HBH54_178660 [Parastagonospora nodorum]KAH4138839.1 hypothetical protein HBH45_107020 [Parastagonospora nodorum]KAH4163415.1 hypothetical protein HBH44_082400 [Parastagonospora nodorum]KAH4185250.1 hypothetical protein HBH42_178520 [Parastagonospora nodorum]
MSITGLAGVIDFSLGLRALHFKPLLGSGNFTQDGAAWKHSRALLRPQFTSNRYQNFEEIKQLTFGTTTFLLFGETQSSLASSEIAGQESEFAKAFNLSQQYLRVCLGQDFALLEACYTVVRIIQLFPYPKEQKDGKNIQQRGFANGHPLNY